MENQVKKVISRRDKKEYYVCKCRVDYYDNRLYPGKIYQVRKGEGNTVIVNGTFFSCEDRDNYYLNDPIHQHNGYKGTYRIGVVMDAEVARKSFDYILN